MASSDRPLSRRKRLIRRFAAEGIDALLVTGPRNVYYLSGFRGDDSALLVTPGETLLLTDSRYAEEAGEAIRGITLVVRTGSMMRTAAARARRAGVRRLGVEAKTMTLAEHEALRDRARKLEVKPTQGMVEQLRMIKDAGEVAAGQLEEVTRHPDGSVPRYGRPLR